MCALFFLCNLCKITHESINSVRKNVHFCRPLQNSDSTATIKRADESINRYTSNWVLCTGDGCGKNRLYYVRVTLTTPNDSLVCGKGIVYGNVSLNLLGEISGSVLCSALLRSTAKRDSPKSKHIKPKWAENKLVNRK